MSAAMAEHEAITGASESNPPEHANSSSQVELPHHVEPLKPLEVTGSPGETHKPYPDITEAGNPSEGIRIPEDVHMQDTPESTDPSEVRIIPESVQEPEHQNTIDLANPSEEITPPGDEHRPEQEFPSGTIPPSEETVVAGDAQEHENQKTIEAVNPHEEAVLPGDVHSPEYQDPQGSVHHSGNIVLPDDAHKPGHEIVIEPVHKFAGIELPEDAHKPEHQNIAEALITAEQGAPPGDIQMPEVQNTPKPSEEVAVPGDTQEMELHHTTESVNPPGNVKPPGDAHTLEHQGTRKAIHRPKDIKLAEDGSQVPEYQESVQWDQVPVGRTLEVDSSDTDSALGSDTTSLNTSLSSSVTNYRFENGRRYHAYHDGAYFLPNDERESERLDLQHHVWRMTLNGELYISPLPADAGLNVLDIGTGTGIWAIEFAQEHPASVVTGLDLSPIQPPMVPPNCSFIVDNAEMDWIYSQPFDLIHARMLTFGIRDWPRLFRQSWDHLKPGGWVELQELRMPCRCDDGTAPRESPLINWCHIIVDSLATTGIDPLASDKFEQQLAEQGFVNIKAETIKWAIGSWPKGKREKEIGRWTAVNTLAGLEAISLAVLTRQLRWSPEEVELLLMDARKQVMDRNSHAYISVRIVCAQKPFES